PISTASILDCRAIADRSAPGAEPRGRPTGGNAAGQIRGVPDGRRLRLGESGIGRAGYRAYGRVVSVVPTTIDTSSRGNMATPWTGGEALGGTAVDRVAVVQAEHLTKRFGELVAVDDLSFALGRGTVTGFLGPNGAGKTTTLRMLLDL